MLYAGMDEEVAERIGPMPEGRGVLGKLGENATPLRVKDISGHPDSAGFPPDHPPMQSLLGVRVIGDSGGGANLYVANLAGGPEFTLEDEQKIVALAAYAELALDNARLYDEERALRAVSEAAESRLEAVIRGTAAGVVVKRAGTGEFAQVSAEASRITGIRFGDSRLDDGHPHPFELLHHRPDGTPVPRAEIPMNIALSAGISAGPVEVLFIREDGVRLPVLVSAAPVFDTGGKLDSAVSVFVDITRLKELDRAKDEFLSMVTHDLRTPIATIKGMAAAALDAVNNADNERAFSFLEPMDDEVDYLTDLVSNLLDMTRIEAGGDIFDLEVCHLADIAQDSLGRMSRSRDGRDRSIYINVPPDLPPVYADPRQIGRVLDNLLSNALKYSSEGISLTARTEPDSGIIRAEVTDHGPGIPADMQGVIFDRFARLKPPLGKGRQGSGLGLAICRSIVMAHGGNIGVNSTARGSVFWFTLPPDQA
jgi:signal transduction histidine kinase